MTPFHQTAASGRTWWRSGRGTWLRQGGGSSAWSSGSAMTKRCVRQARVVVPRREPGLCPAPGSRSPNRISPCSSSGSCLHRIACAGQRGQAPGLGQVCKHMGGSERRQRGVACPPTVPSFGLGFSQCGRFAPLRISQGGRLAPLGISQCGWSVPFGLGQCGVCLHRDESLWMVCTSALTPQNNPQMLHNGEYIPLLQSIAPAGCSSRSVRKWPRCSARIHPCASKGGAARDNSAF